MNDEPRLPPTPAEVAAMTETVVELRAKLKGATLDGACWASGQRQCLRRESKLQKELEQAHAAAAVMREALEETHRNRPHDGACMSHLGPQHPCSCCGGGAKVKIAAILSTDLAVQARHLLDVVNRAREFLVAYRNWVNRSDLIEPRVSTKELDTRLWEAHRNLVGAFAVYDDKRKKEQADGEEES